MREGTCSLQWSLPAFRTTNDAVGATGTWIPDPLQYEADEQTIKAAAERGVSFLSYDNAVPIIDLSPIRTRSFFWKVWRTIRFSKSRIKTRSNITLKRINWWIPSDGSNYVEQKNF